MSEILLKVTLSTITLTHLCMAFLYYCEDFFPFQIKYFFHSFDDIVNKKKSQYLIILVFYFCIINYWKINVLRYDLTQHVLKGILTKEKLIMEADISVYFQRSFHKLTIQHIFPLFTNDGFITI
jgi:hypothetical protein